MTAILAFDMKEHMVVFQKTLGKDHKATYCMNCMSVVEDISSLVLGSTTWYLAFLNRFLVYSGLEIRKI